MPRHGQWGGIAGRGTRLQSLLGLTARASQAVAPAAAAGMRQEPTQAAAA
jgi:hypothetical protein